ncbi:MAG: glycosyltransferase family 4 protein [Pseudomonadota bacterium]
MEDNGRPLKICMISYRSNPFCGGQGVYVKQLSRALTDLGHTVEVVSGPPDPCLDPDVAVHRLPCLDLYDPANFCRLPTIREFMDPVNVIEWLGVCTMGFPEPYTFGLRARRFLRDKFRKYDVIHDNQSLSHGVLALKKFRPTIATIHHPITQDRKIDLMSVKAPWKKMKWARWYSFLGMQKKVARGLTPILTVSACARRDISRDFGIPEDRFRIAPNGIDIEAFRPLPGIERDPNRLIVTNSADMPLKGLNYLLLALAALNQKRDARLTVIGAPKRGGMVANLVKDLGLGEKVYFTGRVSQEEFRWHYAKASVAVVPSVYEGFGLPAGEAMACGLPVVSTTGGALPEVVGDAGLLVPTRDPAALAQAVATLLDNPEYAAKVGRAGYERVHSQFTWKNAALKTAAAYREAIRDYR